MADFVAQRLHDRQPRIACGTMLRGRRDVSAPGAEVVVAALAGSGG